MLVRGLTSHLASNMGDQNGSRKEKKYRRSDISPEQTAGSATTLGAHSISEGFGGADALAEVILQPYSWI